MLIAVRKVEPPISLGDAFFLKQGIDFHQDTQASNEATYVNLDEAPLIHCQGHLSPWLGAATVLISAGCGVAGKMDAEGPATRWVSWQGCEQTLGDGEGLSDRLGEASAQDSISSPSPVLRSPEPAV